MTVIKHFVLVAEDVVGWVDNLFSVLHKCYHIHWCSNIDRCLLVHCCVECDRCVCVRVCVYVCVVVVGAGISLSACI